MSVRSLFAVPIPFELSEAYPYIDKWHLHSILFVRIGTDILSFLIYFWGKPIGIEPNYETARRLSY
jgi:hypothetical protein